MYPYARFVLTPIRLAKSVTKKNRRLEIGPGSERVQGFETINVVWGKQVDYIGDATGRLPFSSDTFDVIYASHILEHTPWFNLTVTLKEWVRVLRPGGVLEVWVPDGYKLTKFIIDIEEGVERSEWLDDWRPHNFEGNPYKWANGRLLYGVATGYPAWHTAIITPKFLAMTMCEAGLSEIEIMPEAMTRGRKHGWINLGVRGIKR